MKFTIDSAAVRGDYMRDIVDRTIVDIHDSISTVFGPYAVDAYIHKNGQLYYTRDGKEVLASMNYDNVISNDVLKMIYQAVERQATLVGDGTTTLAVLYTNLYGNIRNKDLSEFSLNTIRRTWNHIISKVNEKLKEYSQPMEDGRFRDMLYTCTQDADLTELIYDKLGDAVKEQAYMVIEKSNMDNELEVDVHNEPLVKAEKIYSTYSVPLDASTIDNTIIFYVDGTLDISEAETFAHLGQLYTEQERQANMGPSNILILCNGTTETTRKAINNYQAIVAKNPDKKFNNIIIAKILNSLEYTEDMKEDFIAYLYNDIGVSSVVNAITFESLMYQAFGFDATTEEIHNRFYSYDFDPHTLDLIREAYVTRRGIAFAPGKGLRIYGEMPFVAKARYDELVNAIETEKSGVDRVRLQKRLRTVYGKFIEVRVGSTLIKDSQRKYELILDAVKSSMDAYKEGVLYGNSILYAFKAVSEFTPENKLEEFLYSILKDALDITMEDLLHSTDHEYYISEDLIEKSINKFNVNDEKISDTISGDIVEPVSIMTMILKNSTMCFELALAKLFCVDTSVRNYID